MGAAMVREAIGLDTVVTLAASDSLAVIAGILIVVTLLIVRTVQAPCPAGEEIGVSQKLRLGIKGNRAKMLGMMRLHRIRSTSMSRRASLTRRSERATYSIRRPPGYFRLGARSCP